jgi:DNA-binding NtrC family response regulator
VVPIEIPPLRQRREDILPLALQFLKFFNKKYGVSRSIGKDLLRVLEYNDWPGNVRELQNTIERMAVTADSDVLEPRHMPDSVGPCGGREEPPPSWIPDGMGLQEAKDLLEREMIQKALTTTNNTREAARLLGVAHSTVVRKAQKYGLHLAGESRSTRLH